MRERLCSEGPRCPVSPFKVEVVTAGQDRPPHATDLLLGSVHRKLVESFQGEELLLWHWEKTRREELEEDFIQFN